MTFGKNFFSLVRQYSRFKMKWDHYFSLDIVEKLVAWILSVPLKKKQNDTALKSVIVLMQKDKTPFSEDSAVAQ